MLFYKHEVYEHGFFHIMSTPLIYRVFVNTKIKVDGKHINVILRCTLKNDLWLIWALLDDVWCFMFKHHLFYFYKNHLSLGFEKGDAYKR